MTTRRLSLYILLGVLSLVPGALILTAFGPHRGLDPILLASLTASMERTVSGAQPPSSGTNRRKLKPFLHLLTDRYSGVYLTNSRGRLLLGAEDASGAQQCISRLSQGGTRGFAAPWTCFASPENTLHLALSDPTSPPLPLALWLAALLPLLGAFLFMVHDVRRDRRLLTLGRTMKQVGAGGLPRIPAAGQGELGELSRSLAVMVALIREKEEHLADQLAITGRQAKRLEQSERELLNREKMATVGRLAAGLAHELGNPVAALMGLVELLAEGNLPEDVVRENYTLMEQELARMDGLIRQLLAFARPTPPERIPTDPSEAVTGAIELARARRDVRETRFVNRVPQDGPWVLASSELTQVLLNLFINSAHAAGPGGTIEVFTEPSPESLSLFVLDQGPGIPKEMEEEIFEPFVTTKEPGIGTGLGLSISRKLMESMDGALTLEKTGKGACFRLRLPWAP